MQRSLRSLALILLFSAACTGGDGPPGVVVGSSGGYVPTGDGSGDGGSTSCKSTCDVLACGLDPCGYICGVCATGLHCTDGSCVSDEDPMCVANCEGRACGKDGCGGLCGVCGEEELCTAGGRCVLKGCTPSCEGKECGDNGCMGSCGACGPGFSCDEDGSCIPTGCQAACQERTCGDDGCGGSCGACAPGQVCSAEGQCAPKPCTPKCEGKQCGPDGCGGDCGPCTGDDAACFPDHVCRKLEPGVPCNGVDHDGGCIDQTLVYCAKGKLQVEECAPVGKSCLKAPDGDWFDCL